MNKNPLEEKHKLSNNLPVPIEILDQTITKPNESGIYHYHDYLELIFCVQGQLELKTFNKNVVLNEGDTVLINSGEPHGTTSLTSVSRHYCIKFLKELLTPFYDGDIIYYIKLTTALSKINSFVYIPSKDVLEYKQNMKQLFAESSECYLDNNASNRMSIYANILNIVSFALRYFDPNFSENTDLQFLKSKLDIIQKINRYIKENYQEVTLERLARECSVNYSYLSTLFKELYGESFRSYIIKYRINESVSLLCETAMDISTIAQTVGFSTASHYIKMFRQLKNVSPGKFRQLTKSKNI